jgi:hypothetical protein
LSIAGEALTLCSAQTGAGENNESELVLAFHLLPGCSLFARKLSIEDSPQASQNYKRHNGISFVCAFCNFVVFLVMPLCSFEHPSKGKTPEPDGDK